MCLSERGARFWRASAFAPVFVLVFVFVVVFVFVDFVVVFVVVSLLSSFSGARDFRLLEPESIRFPHGEEKNLLTPLRDGVTLLRMDSRSCANCHRKFDPRVDWQECCTPQCASALRQRRYRAKHRKGGGGDGGGGNGGGGIPTLFDTIETVSSEAFVPGVIPVIGPPESGRRKPVSAQPKAKSHRAKNAA